MHEDQSSRWRASASPGGLVGLVLTILAIIAVVASVLGITGRADLPLPTPLLWAVFAAALVAAILFAFLVWAYLSIGYTLTSDSLRIEWGLWSDGIPLSEIRSVSPVTEVVNSQPGGWQPFWPGYYVGKHQTEAGTIQVISTQPPRRQVLISVADGRMFAISPERPLLFMEEFSRWHGAPQSREPADAQPVATYGQPVQQFVDAGWTTEFSVVGSVTETGGAVGNQSDVPAEPSAYQIPRHEPVSVYRSRPSSTSPILRPAILRDQVAIALMAIGVLTTAAMVVYILIQYQDIPPSLTLHWNVDGLPGRVGEPREIWILPTIAGLVLVANLGLAWSIALFDRFAARLMLASTIVVHLVTWVALLMVLR